MKKYAPYLTFAGILVVLIVGYLLWRKKQINDQLDEIVSFDGERQMRKGQQVHLNKAAELQQVTFEDGEAVNASTWRLRPTDKLYYVGKYNNFNLVKRKGWFFDRYFLASNTLIK